MTDQSTRSIEVPGDAQQSTWVAERIHTADLARSAADLFVAAMLRAVHARGEFIVSLSGGSTPLAMYRRLAAQTSLPWARVRIFWGDERFVPHDHPDSNYWNAMQAFLSKLPVPRDRIHPWPQPTGRREPQAEIAQAAQDYAKLLKDLLGAEPLFDLQLLGLGSDAHSASLYPYDQALHDTALTSSATPANVLHPRLTLTPTALSNSRTVAFLVSGERKREALAGTLATPRVDPAFPARYISALDKRVVLTDLYF